MRFPVGSGEYQVRVAQGPVKFEERDVSAAMLPKDREVLISATCEPSRRLHVMVRELASAWAHETGKPSTDAGWHALCATVFCATLKALIMQGGEAALMALDPGESPEPAAARIGLNTSRCCAQCGGTVAGGSVAWEPDALPGFAMLKLYCEHCDKTQVWREAMNANGLPSNRPVGQPRFERGDTTGISLPMLMARQGEH